MDWEKAGNSGAPAESQDRTRDPEITPQGLGFLHFSVWVGGRMQQGPPSLGALPGVRHLGVWPVLWCACIPENGGLRVRDLGS